MDPAPSLGCSLKDVKWSSVAVPLDLLVSTYRLPQIARLDSGESRPGRRHRADRRGPQSLHGCARVCWGGWDRVGSGLPAHPHPHPRRWSWPERLPQPWRVALSYPQQQLEMGKSEPLQCN